MFDPNFDPYDELRKIARNLELINNNIIEVSRAINHHGTAIQDLHNRLRLIEIARQYDQKTTTRKIRD